MFKITKYFALLLSVLVFTSYPRAIKAQNEVTLKIENTEQINLCGEERNKRVIITLYLGKIIQSDSLFGFNGELNYNPEKIQFHTALPINTLAEFFEYNRADFAQKGKINFTVSQWMSNIPISGDRPLYAFLGNYLGKCPDTSWVNLDYIEFTDEFKKKIKEVSNGLVKADIVYDETRYLKTHFELDTLEFFKDDSIKTIQVIFDVLPGLRINSLQLIIQNDNPNQFEINDIVSLNEYIIIDSIRNDDEIIELYLSVLNDTIAGINLKLSLIEKFKSDTISKITIEPTNINECTCVSKLISSDCYLISHRKDTIPSSTFIEDQSKELNYTFNGNEFTIYNNNNESIHKIIIYDLLGKEIMRFDNINNSQYIINTESLEKGFYIIYIMMNNNREIKKLIKN